MVRCQSKKEVQRNWKVTIILREPIIQNFVDSKEENGER